MKCRCEERVSRSPEPFGFAQDRLREGDEAISMAVFRLR
jgi:hypothetical protein